jgi:hypothetical protein
MSCAGVTCRQRTHANLKQVDLLPDVRHRSVLYPIWQRTFEPRCNLHCACACVLLPRWPVRPQAVHVMRTDTGALTAGRMRGRAGEAPVESEHADRILASQMLEDDLDAAAPGAALSGD